MIFSIAKCNQLCQHLIMPVVIVLLLIPMGVSAQIGNPASAKLYLPHLAQSGPIAIAFAERQAVLNAIQAQFDAQPGVEVETEHLALADYILAQPHVVAAGVAEDGSVWGRFDDDRLLIVLPTAPPAEPTQAATLAAPRVATTPVNLPGTDNAYVMNALGTCYASQSELISTWLTNQKYVVASTAPTVPELRTVKDAAVFFIDTHGGSGIDFVGQPTYAMWTATPVDLQWDINLSNDLFAGRLVYALAKHNRATPPAQECTTEWHYALTAAFVSTYMTFAPHSFIFFNGCSSASAAALSMQQAFAQAGAAMYAGWTWPVGDSDSNNAALFLFHRLLGAISELSDTPLQRPFDLPDVLEELEVLNLGISEYCPAGHGACPPNRPIAALLTFTSLVSVPTQEFTLLAPTIAHAETRDPPCCDGPDLVRLDVFGLFGDEQGEVFVDNTPLTVLAWMTDTIQVEVPAHGPGSAGDIVVKVRGHASNPAPLTEWRGQVHWRENYDNVMGAAGPYADVICDLHLRANFHASRSYSGDVETLPDYARIEESQDSRCSWQMEGEASWVEVSTGVKVRAVLSGSGEFAWRPPSAGPGAYLGFSGVVHLDEPIQQLELSLIGLVSGEWTVYRDGIFSYRSEQPLLGTGPVILPLNLTYDVLPGSSSFAFVQGTVTTTWDAIPARFAPDDNTPG